MTGNRNRTLRMYSALIGFAVVAVIALFTALGHHHATPPGPAGNLYTSSGQSQPAPPVTTPPATPSPASSTFTYVNPYQGPAGGAICTAVAQTATRARYKVTFTATGPVHVENFDVSFWTAEGGLITNAAIAPPSLDLTAGQSQTLHLFTPLTTLPGSASWDNPPPPPGQQPSWACTVTSYTVAK